MDRPTMRRTVLAALADVAPEADLAHLRDADLIQEALDLDSFDFLTFIEGLHRRTGVDVPELDYPQVATVDGAITYLLAHGGVDAVT
jgi:acyl carrier protein